MRPAAGVWCSRCLTKGHKCQAQMYEENVPLCLYCADEVPCSVDRVGPPQAPEMYEPERGMPETPAPAERPRWNGRLASECAPKKTQRVAPEVMASPAQKEAILAYPDETSFSQIARDLSVDLAVVMRIRKGAGLRGMPFGAPRNTRAKAKPETKVIAGEPVTMTSGVVMGPEVLAPERKRGMVDLEQEVLKHAGKMTDGEVAKRCGCSGARVHQIRKKHNIPAAPGATGGRKPKAERVEPKTAMVKAAQRTIEIDASKPAAVDRLIEREPVGEVVVTVRLTRAEALRRIETFSSEQLGAALAAAMQTGLRG